jgi:ferric-dicitrate binding protein FerR (iron transport regulator)
MKNENPLTPQDEQKAQRVAYLLGGFLRHSLTEAELDELDAWIVESDDNQLLFEELTDPKNIEAGIKRLKGIDAEKALQRIKTQMKRPEVPLLARRHRHLWTYGIAASILLLATVFFYNRPSKENKPGIIAETGSDLKPGSNKAILTLADGTIIDLDKQKNGLVKNENGVQVNKVDDGQLTYITSNGPADGMRYNTLTTPIGGQYKVTLPDKTVAWLNAASSLKYPVAFTGNERNVELSGEGYFEVTKNEKQPFKVLLKNGAEVQVLGTHFNINAYDDEPAIRTTLLEGSVSVTSDNTTVQLQPGQQAILKTDGTLLAQKNASTEEAVAWKEGKFVFKNAPIESIMRQVARWYDVDVQYEGKLNYHFNATIERDTPVSRLFKLLELTGNVNFIITGNKIIVRP